MDLNSLEPSHFERLCRALLCAEVGATADLNENGAIRRDQYHGPDINILLDSGTRWVGEVKRFKKVSSPALLNAWLQDAARSAARLNAERAVLCVSSRISDDLRSGIDPAVRHVELYDGPAIEALAAKHPNVQESIEELSAVEQDLRRRFELVFLKQETGLRTSKPISYKKNPPPKPTVDFRKRLAAIAPGRKQWRSYENLCTELLAFVFRPDLRPPITQSRTENGRDRRDAIFPIAGRSPFWDEIRYNFTSRMVVVEFKNYAEKIGQKEVELTGKYLVRQAQRAFALICSRQPASISAIDARRRIWVEKQSLVLFLSDGDLLQLVEMKEQGIDPTTLLELQMDQFFVEFAL